MRIPSLALAFLLTLASRNLAGATLRAGVARVDITPPPGELMWGYENRRQPATGTLDPLYARVLVLEAGPEKSSRRLALVTLDLGRSFGPSSLARLRAAAQQSSGIACLLVAASHTHSAPVIRDEYRNAPPPGSRPRWTKSRMPLRKLPAACRRRAWAWERARSTSDTIACE